MGPLCPISIYGSPVALLKFQMARRIKRLMSSGSKKKEPRCACLSEAKASHWQKMWAEVSSSAPLLLHSGLSDNPIKWRCLLRVLCPVRRPVTALYCVLLKDRDLALAPRQGPEINSRACLWVSPRPRHHIQWWLTNQRLFLLRISCLETPKAGLDPTNFKTETSLASSSAISLPRTPTNRIKFGLQTFAAAYVRGHWQASYKVRTSRCPLLSRWCDVNLAVARKTAFLHN